MPRIWYRNPSDDWDDEWADEPVTAVDSVGLPPMGSPQWKKLYSHVDDAVDRYVKFNDLTPKKISKLDIEIPQYVCKVGEMIDIRYHSKKWDDPADYIHHHQTGVNLAVPFEVDGGEVVELPEWFAETRAIAKLGDCLGVQYKSLEGEKLDIESTKPYPHLYSTANGRGLLIISGNQIEALIWGGFMSVEPEGIVG